MVCSCNTTIKKNRIEESFQLIEGSLYKFIYRDNSILISIISKSQLNKDSVKHGRTEFYKDGALSSVTFYKNGYKDSLETVYFKSKRLKRRTLWKDGLKFGSEKLFYDSTETFFAKKDGDTVEVNAPIVKAYRFYDLEGNVRYEREYDVNGVLSKERGSVIGIVAQTDLSILPNDDVHLEFYMVKPDWVYYEFYVNLYNEHKELLSKDTLSFNDQKIAFFYTKKINDAGAYSIECIGIIKDQLTEKVTSDTLNIELNVNIPLKEI